MTASVFGTVAVVALKLGRQVRSLLNNLNWGLSIASSTWVGQQLRIGDETEAEEYGWDIIRVSVISYLILAKFGIVFAKPIASVFVSEPDVLSLTIVFVIVGAISAIGLGIDGAAHGVLRGNGDTRWPFYGRLFGYYVCAVPVAYLETVTPLGIAGLHLALLLETFVPGTINMYRFQITKWKTISREYRLKTNI